MSTEFKDMRLIKEFCPSYRTETGADGQEVQTPQGGRCILRTNHYGSKLDFILWMFGEAKKDFPDLVPDRVEVIRYAGQRYAKTFGIEFNVETPALDEYNRVRTVEFI